MVEMGLQCLLEGGDTRTVSDPPRCEVQPLIIIIITIIIIIIIIIIIVKSYYIMRMHP